MPGKRAAMPKKAAWFWVLTGLTPLGFLFPKIFRADPAWGEWSLEAVRGMVGYAPAGMQKLATLWRAPLRDYAFTAAQPAGWMWGSLAYLFCAFLGAACVALLGWIIGRRLLRGRKG